MATNLDSKQQPLALAALLADTKITTTIFSLPNEMLDMISDRVERKRDMLSLRLASRRLAKAGSRTLQMRTRDIYLEASHSAIWRFYHICDCPFLAEGIRNICVVAPRKMELPRGPALRDVFDLESSYERHVSREAWAEYAQYDVEQKEVMEMRGLQAALLYGVKSLPNLSGISWASSPLLTGFPHISRTNPEPHLMALNCARRWRCVLGPKSDPASPVDELWNKLMWDVRHELFYDLPSVLAVILRHRELRPQQPLRLGIDSCSANDFGWFFASLHATQSTRMAAAVSHIEGLEFIVPGPGNNDHVPFALTERSAFGWFKFFQAAKGLTDLAIVADHLDATAHFYDVLKVLLHNGLVFPYLTDFTLDGIRDFQYPEVGTSYRINQGHTPEELMTFLRRHKSTLQNLWLSSVSGVDEITRQPDVAAFRKLLDVVKNECLQLQQVAVHGVSAHFSELDHATGGLIERANEEVMEREKDSELAKLARELDIFVFKDLMKATYETPSGAFLPSRDYRFTYQFGWKVLRPELGDCNCDRCRSGLSRPCARSKMKVLAIAKN